jgi:hypothetical protein
MAQHLESIPYNTGIIEGKNDPIASVWYLWFFGLVAVLSAAPTLVATGSLKNKGASIPTTPIAIDDAQGGYYRVSIYARITRPATTSSSLTVQIGWTESGQTLLYAFPALTGNSVLSVLMQEPVIKNDQASPITYSTIYASAGAVTMQYSLDIAVERLGMTA